MYKKWTLEDIKDEVNKLELKWRYSCNIPIEISKRATRRMGAFFYKQKQEEIEPIKLVFAHDLLNGNYPEEIVREVIIHEYIHFYCDVKTGISNGHNKLFKEMCRANGISTSATFKYEIKKKDVSKSYKICCRGCGRVVCIHKRIDSAKRKVMLYISKCCSEKLEIKI